MKEFKDIRSPVMLRNEAFRISMLSVIFVGQCTLTQVNTLFPHPGKRTSVSGLPLQDLGLKHISAEMSTDTQRKPKVLALMPFQAIEDSYLTNFKSRFILDVGYRSFIRYEVSS